MRLLLALLLLAAPGWAELCPCVTSENKYSRECCAVTEWQRWAATYERQDTEQVISKTTTTTLPKKRPSTLRRETRRMEKLLKHAGSRPVLIGDLPRNETTTTLPGQNATTLPKKVIVQPIGASTHMSPPVPPEPCVPVGQNERRIETTSLGDGGWLACFCRRDGTARLEEHDYRAEHYLEARARCEDQCREVHWCKAKP